ncbi:unnamed protein product [Linum trigynum]|uniref:Uncharacterized protein n=1 Tax=Linum trigynum TaxID=586398 RepID=A0AAV2CLR1_9ROSI
MDTTSPDPYNGQKTTNETTGDGGDDGLDQRLLAKYREVLAKFEGFEILCRELGYPLPIEYAHPRDLARVRDMIDDLIRALSELKAMLLAGK